MLTRSPSVLALLVVALPLGAQEVSPDTARIAPVIVTATRSPLAAGRVPASASVVTGDELRAQGITTVAEALRQVPGLSIVQTGSYGGAASLFIRGGESKFTKVLVDGVPVNEAGGAFDLSTLSTDNLDRIEIVRGPASVLYGSDAMAGVVQLFTRAGAGRPRTEISARGGGHGSLDADASVRGGTAGTSFSLGAARHRTEGFQPFNSQFRQNVGSAMLGGTRGALDARLSLRYTDRELHFPTNGSGQVVDSNAVRRDGRLAVGLDAGYRLSARARLQASLASHDVNGTVDDQPDGPTDEGYAYTTDERSRRRSGDLRLEIDLPAATQLTMGAQVERKWQESITRSNFGDDAPAPARRRTTGAYAQLLAAPAAPYTLTLGGRYEHNEQFGDFLTYRAAASARVAPTTRLRVSVGTAFREPTFLETEGSGFVIGDPNLEPEHAFSVDAGIEHTFGAGLTVGATYFDNSFRDLIDYRYSATEPNYFNIARTRARGAELEGRVTLAPGFLADASMTYLSTRVVDAGTSDLATAAFAPGARLLRRPMHTMSVGLAYRAGGHGIALRTLRVGPRDDSYYAPDFTVERVSLRAYTRADLSADSELLRPAAGPGSVAATIRIENLTDARYTEAAGYNYDFSRTDAESIGHTGYRGAGRRLMAGVRLVF